MWAFVRRSIAVCRRRIGESSAESLPPRPRGSAAAAAANFPIVSDARLAGDAKQTRFVLDLDKPIQFRAFTAGRPLSRGASIFRRSASSFRPEAGTTGRGLVKAFRYGLVMPGGSRIVFDLTGPAKIAKSYVLEAANGQPPRLVIEFEAGRPHRLRPVAGAREPSRTAARDRRCQCRRGAGLTDRPRRRPRSRRTSDRWS